MAERLRARICETTTPSHFLKQSCRRFFTIGFRRLALLVCFCACGVAARAETWTTLNGQTFEAQFRGMWGDAAIFERSDGMRAAITLLNMNAQSRIRLEKLSKEVDSRRKQRVEQLKQQAIDAAAMEADGAAGIFGNGPPASLPPLVAYEPIADDMDLESSVKHLINQSASGHIQIYWDALPVSFQNQLDKMRVELTLKTPADQWNARVDLLSKLAKVLQDKQDFVVGLSMFASMPAPIKDSMQQSLTPIVDQLNMIVQNDRLTHAAVSEVKLGTFIAGLSTDINGQLRKLIETAPTQRGGLPDIANIQITQDGDDRGSVTDSVSGETTNWVRVEGRWISERIANDWAGNLEKARTQIESMFGEASNDMVTQVTTVLDELATAGNQQAFESTLFRVLLQLGPKLQEWGIPGAAPGL